MPLVGHVLHFRVPWTGDDWDGGLCASSTIEEIERNERQQQGVPSPRNNEANNQINNIDSDARSDSRSDSHSHPHSQSHSQSDLEDSRDRNGFDSTRLRSGSRSPVRRASLTDVFRAKGQEQRGLFQDVGLYSCFGPALIPSLWHLWELVLTGKPIMVFAPTPALCSQTVLGLVSLIAPIGYDDDFRPFLTIYDPDFREISAACAAANSAKQHQRINSNPTTATNHKTSFHHRSTHHISSPYPRSNVRQN